MKKLLKYLFLLSFSLSQDFIPQNEISINYNQVFFKWPQMNSSTNPPGTFLYTLYLSSDNETLEYTAFKNSILIEDLSWDTEYYWYVCAQDSSDSNFNNCYEEFNFVMTPSRSLTNDCRLALLYSSSALVNDCTIFAIILSC